MGKLYIPYKDKKPAAIFVNGHRLILVSKDEEDLCENLHLVDATDVKQIEIDDDAQFPESKELESLATTLDASIVVAPEDLPFQNVLEALKYTLPWIQ